MLEGIMTVIGAAVGLPAGFMLTIGVLMALYLDRLAKSGEFEEPD